MNVQHARRPIQIIFLIFFLVAGLGTIDAICPFLMTQMGIPKLLGASKILLPLMVASLGTTLILVILFGRAFCSWICPFGTILELVGKIGSEKMTLPETLDDPGLKYMMLLGFIGAAAFLTYPVFCYICPAGTFLKLIGPVGLNTSTMYLSALLVLVGVLGGTILYGARTWCKYLCPLGALLAILDKTSFLRIRIDTEACIECLRCQDNCPVDVLVIEEGKWHSDGVVPTGECIRCGICIDNCPTDALGYSTVFRRGPSPEEILRKKQAKLEKTINRSERALKGIEKKYSKGKLTEKKYKKLKEKYTKALEEAEKELEEIKGALEK